jgi:MFS family permease
MAFLHTLLKKNTALLLSGQLISTMGSIMQTTALALFVMAKNNNDALVFASVLAVGIIPRLFGPFTGVFADRQNRKRLLVVLDVIAGFITFCFALWHQFFGGLLLPCVYCLVIFLATIQTFYDPTVSAIIPEVVEHKSLEEVNSASSFITSAACLAAPILAGVIYSRNNNLFVVMLINSASFILAAILEACMGYKPASALHTAAQEPVLKSFKEGLAAVFGNKELTLIIVISIIANLALNPIFSVGMPFIMKQVLHVSDELFGVSQSMLFIGPLIGSIAAGFILKRVDYKKMLTWILIADSALVAVLALLSAFGGITTGQLALFIGINVTAMVIVATIVLASIAISTALQRIVPVHLLGRVSGVDVSVSLMAIPLGQLLFGLGTTVLKAPVTLLLFACIVIITGFVSYLLYKPMLKGQAVPAEQPHVEL